MRPYVDHPVTDLDGAERAAHHAATVWGLPEPTVLRAGMNLILQSGTVVLRVGQPSGPGDAALRLAETLTHAGIRVVEPALDDVVERVGFTVTCWRLVEPTAEPIDWAAVGGLVRRVHELDPAIVPADYPLPSPQAFPWWDFEAMMDDVGGAIDPAARGGLRAAIDRWPTWWATEQPVVCHGDVHPGNVLMSSDGPLLIDWDLLCLAPRGWDHGPMMTWHERWGGAPGEYERFAAGYGADLQDDPGARAIAELRLVAATLMRVRAGRHDPLARAEADRRLAYWRGDVDAPQWSAQ